MLVTTYALDLLLLQNEVLHAAAGPFSGALDGAKIMMLAGIIPITKASLIADLEAVEAAYAGYARQTITWSSVTQRPDGAVAVRSQLTYWQMSDAVLPTNLYGYGIVGPGGSPILLAAELFDAPVPLVVAEQALPMVVEYVQGAAGDYGSAIVLAT